MQPETEWDLWKMSCSARRSILSTSSLSTFSLSLSSNCCVVSKQYSDVQRMLHVWRCSSSVNLITSPSFSRLWIRLLADAIVGCCLENFSSWPDKLSCLLILQQKIHYKFHLPVHTLYHWMNQLLNEYTHTHTHTRFIRKLQMYTIKAIKLNIAPCISYTV